MNVGNGGFSLRSTKLLRYVHKHRAQFPVINDLDDDLFCRKYRPHCKQLGSSGHPKLLPMILHLSACVPIRQRGISDFMQRSISIMAVATMNVCWSACR